MIKKLCALIMIFVMCLSESAFAGYALFQQRKIELEKQLEKARQEKDPNSIREQAIQKEIDRIEERIKQKFPQEKLEDIEKAQPKFTGLG